MKFTQEDLDESIRIHNIWLTTDGDDGHRAVLSDLDLSGLDFSNANLKMASIIDSNISGANFQGSNLTEARLVGSDFSGANLRGANLWRADLRGANLSGANMLGADLSYANMENASLEDAIWPDGKPAATIEQSDELARIIAAKVLHEPGDLVMGEWHSDCGTAHCLAGWAEFIVDNVRTDFALTHARGRQLLPTLSHLFFAYEDEVMEVLRKIDDAG